MPNVVVRCVAMVGLIAVCAARDALAGVDLVKAARAQVGVTVHYDPASLHVERVMSSPDVKRLWVH